ncbi:MAG: hypothetical protein A4E28_01718 [Methanocella sp. PtaU1.Bin125]|nr:MAG: hypothetical protein A4E28_01718 [Methanocella sp. PtaU1.Bin125]
MPLFEWTEGVRYYKMTFTAAELEVIKVACTSKADSEYGRMDAAAGEGLDRFVAQAQKVRDYEVAGEIVAGLKPGQPVLLAAVDIRPLQECLRAYCQEAAGDRLAIAKSALKKIDEACQTKG